MSKKCTVINGVYMCSIVENFVERTPPKNNSGDVKFKVNTYTPPKKKERKRRSPPKNTSGDVKFKVNQYTPPKTKPKRERPKRRIPKNREGRVTHKIKELKKKLKKPTIKKPTISRDSNIKIALPTISRNSDIKIALPTEKKKVRITGLATSRSGRTSGGTAPTSGRSGRKAASVTTDRGSRSVSQTLTRLKREEEEAARKAAEEEAARKAAEEEAARKEAEEAAARKEAEMAQMIQTLSTSICDNDEVWDKDACITNFASLPEKLPVLMQQFGISDINIVMEAIQMCAPGMINMSEEVYGLKPLGEGDDKPTCGFLIETLFPDGAVDIDSVVGPEVTLVTSGPHIADDWKWFSDQLTSDGCEYYTGTDVSYCCEDTGCRPSELNEGGDCTILTSAMDACSQCSGMTCPTSDLSDFVGGDDGSVGDDVWVWNGTSDWNCDSYDPESLSWWCNEDGEIGCRPSELNSGTGDCGDNYIHISQACPGLCDTVVQNDCTVNNVNEDKCILNRQHAFITPVSVS